MPLHVHVEFSTELHYVETTCGVVKVFPVGYTRMVSRRAAVQVILVELSVCSRPLGIFSPYTAIGTPAGFRRSRDLGCGRSGSQRTKILEGLVHLQVRIISLISV
jgi:hypothetical protein